MFGLPVFLIKPIFCVLAAAAAAFVLHQLWTGVKVHIAAPYVAAQIAKDQPRIAAAEANAKQADLERNNAKEDTKTCQAAAKTQSDAIATADERARKAQAETRAIIAAAKQESAVRESHIKSLQALAAAPPKKDMACAEELAKARGILQDTLRQRRGIPAVMGPPNPRDALGLPAAK